MPAKKKPVPVPVTEPSLDQQARYLCELARQYPWRSFDQSELKLITGYPRQAISAAFNDPEFPCQFGRSRPEDIVQWIRKQDPGIRVKELT